MTDEERDRLEGRIERAFAGQPIASALAPVRAIVGPYKMPGGQDLAEAAREKLAKKQQPTPLELAALELMVRLLRPSLLTVKGVFEPLAAENQYAAELRAHWETFRTSLGALVFSVGRIDMLDGVPVGTGFLVAPDRIVTNSHVLDALSFGTFELERGQGQISFRQEWSDQDEEGPVNITRVIGSDATLDVALLEIDALPQARPAFVFDAADGAAGDLVAVLGYPARDTARNRQFTDALFQSAYNVKRGAPGEIIKTLSSVAFHDCSTLGGNSGSPVVSLRTGKVVGVHRSGRFMFRNEAVPLSALQAFLSKHATN